MKPSVLSRVTLLAVLSFFLWRAIGAFGPGSESNNIDFNSDSAIPVLMSNDQGRITVFNFYYYGADRWGGWPFLVTQFVGRASGYRWTAESVFVLQAIWIFVGVLAFASLSPRDRLLSGVLYLIALCLHRESRYLIFELSQVYAWQTTACLLSWWTLRRLFEDRLEPAQSRLLWKGPVWLLLAFGFSFLAIWSSVASTLFLGFLLCLETLRAQLKRRPALRARRLLTPFVMGLTAIVSATLIERLLKVNYRRYSLLHYGDDFATHFGLDTGYLAENLSQQLRLLGKLSWWPLYVLPTLALLALACAFVYGLIWKNDKVREGLRKAFADDTACLALGAYGLAALNLALAVMVSHVRVNGYDDRYLTLTNIFGPISGLLTAFLLLGWMVRSSRASPYVRPALVLVALALLTSRFPGAGYSPSYELSKTTARALARKAPHAVLMGTYWDTYVFTALQGDAAMVPVPFEGQVTRTPWTRNQVQRADQVIVAYRRGAPGVMSPPPPILREYGRTFKLVDPRWYETREYRFAQYVNETR